MIDWLDKIGLAMFVRGGLIIKKREKEARLSDFVNASVRKSAF